MSIRVQNVSKSFGPYQALDRVNIEVPSGALVALLGPSGCGKTTMLRIIAGLETADTGNIFVDGKDVSARHVRERNVGFVFQHYALFRHMTVFENIAFGLRIRRHPEALLQARVRELTRLIRLEGVEQRYPAQLSGGQRQRVALARALAAEPQVLLLDEPFGSLDAKVRQELRQWLRRLHDEIHTTSVFVTHDQEEAFEVADRVVVMNQGRVEQIGTPQEVFEYPANAFVMDFLGKVNVFHGRVASGVFRTEVENVDGMLLGNLEVSYPEYTSDEIRPMQLYIRPHELEVVRTTDNPSNLQARVLHITAMGSVATVHLQALYHDLDLTAELSLTRCAELSLQRDEVVFVIPKRIRGFAANPN